MISARKDKWCGEMIHDVRNLTIKLGPSTMDCACFGQGEDTLVILPGLSDGLHTVRGTAAQLALTYRAYAKRYRVYVFSRKNELAVGCTTRDMARDQAEAMRALDIGPAYVLGLSQGGMVAQYLTIDAPELVRKLVLAVSLAAPNETLRSTIPPRIAWAKERDYHSIVIDTIEKSSSTNRLKLYHIAYPLLGRFGAPEDFTRFIIHASACLTHDARAELGRITCPTLVIGGGSDVNVGPGTSEELAALIPGSVLYLYPDLGHAAFIEAKDFQARVIEFLEK